MNKKRIAIIVCALVLSALIVWYELPIEFPWIIVKMLGIFVKIFIVLALAIILFVFAGKKNKPS